MDYLHDPPSQSLRLRAQVNGEPPPNERAKLEPLATAGFTAQSDGEHEKPPTQNGLPLEPLEDSYKLFGKRLKHVDELDKENNKLAPNRVADNIARHVTFHTNGGLHIINNEEEDGDVTDFGDQLFEEEQKQDGARSATTLPLNSINKSLQDELFSAIHPSHSEKKGFFPKGQLSTMLTEECVRRELDKYLHDLHDEKVIEGYAKKICSKSEIWCGSPVDDSKRKARCFRRLFAILVLIEKTASIVKFLEESEDVSDADLPLIKVPRLNERGMFDLRLRRKRDVVLNCCKNWNQLNVRNFEEWQWTTLSPFFGKGEQRKEVHHYRLQDAVILPFISDSRRDETSAFRTLE